MSILSILVINILPLYVLIGLGYVAGRWLDVNLHSMARIVIFILSPIVMFGAVAQLKFTPEYAALPFIGGGISAIASISMYHLAKRAWGNNTANLIGIGSVSGNTTYFGLPLVLALHDQAWVGVYLLLNFGIGVSESTIGYFLGARGHHSLKDSLKKVAQLPVLHAVWIGLLFNFSGLGLPAIAVRYWNDSIGAIIFIGMMMIGVGLSKIKTLELDTRLLRWLYGAKFIVWPVLGIMVILTDRAFTHLLSPTVQSLTLLLVSAPPASNLVAYAAQLNLHAEKAAMAVLLGTLFAIVYMPALFTLTRLLFGLSP